MYWNYTALPRDNASSVRAEGDHETIVTLNGKDLPAALHIPKLDMAATCRGDAQTVRAEGTACHRIYVPLEGQDLPAALRIPELESFGPHLPETIRCPSGWRHRAVAAPDVTLEREDLPAAPRVPELEGSCPYSLRQRAGRQAWSQAVASQPWPSSLEMSRLSVSQSLRVSVRTCRYDAPSVGAEDTGCHFVFSVAFESGDLPAGSPRSRA